MAEEKKPEKAPEAPKKDPFVEIVTIVGGMLLLVFLANTLITSISQSRIFKLGLRGFTPQAVLISHTRPIASLDHALGVRIASIAETSVFNSPGERKIGSQKLNARGKIIQGPVTIGNTRYWYVDYDTDPDGWVNEADIAYVESENNWVDKILLSIFTAVTILKVISVIFSLICAVIFGYIIYKLTMLRKNQAKLFYIEPLVVPKPINPKWERVMAHAESANEGDWRLAVLEADIMLSELLDNLSLPGDSIGDKLKVVEKSDFLTLDNAWEAHKIRNQIAHEGGDFLLSQREARRVVELYRTVFEEFQMI